MQTAESKMHAGIKRGKAELCPHCYQNATIVIPRTLFPGRQHTEGQMGLKTVKKLNYAEKDCSGQSLKNGNTNHECEYLQKYYLELPTPTFVEFHHLLLQLEFNIMVNFNYISNKKNSERK